MKSFSCNYLVLLLCFTISCGAMAINSSKEPSNIVENPELNYKIKRSTDELDNLLNDIISSEEIPFHIAAEREKIPTSPMLQYLLLRSSNFGHILPNKRSIDYRPRMGRRSNENDHQKGYEPKPYDVFFTPRMGKRSENLSNNVPSYGGSMFTE